MKIDISRPMTVVALRSLLLTADDNSVIEFHKTPKKLLTGLCWCGCGCSTKSKFAPGHDSKFHSLAKQVARGEEDLEVALEGVDNEDAKADFMAHVNAEKPKWAEKQAKLAAAKAAKAKPVAEVSEVPDAGGEDDLEASLMESLGL